MGRLASKKTASSVQAVPDTATPARPKRFGGVAFPIREAASAPAPVPVPENIQRNAFGQARSGLKTWKKASAQDPADAKVAAIEAESAAQIARQQQGATASLQATINQGTVATNRNAQPKESVPAPEPSIEGAQQATDPRRKYRGGGEPAATRGGVGVRLT